MKRFRRNPQASTGGRGPVRWIRRHWRLSALAVALVVVVVGPGFTATQPSFFQRFATLGPYYETWSASTHANVTCQHCHVAPGLVPQATYGVRMVGEIWMSLLPSDREPNVLATPSNDACGKCHVDLRTVSAAGDLRIPHVAHTEALGVACVVCHDGHMVHRTDQALPATPRMATCLTQCHDGQTAKENCDACHTEKPIPDNHLEDGWLISHSEAEATFDCTGCHKWRDDWCSDCHQSRRPASHLSADTPSEWRKVHGDAVSERRNCEACHEGQFCIECHGEVPQMNLDPALQLITR